MKPPPRHIVVMLPLEKQTDGFRFTIYDTEKQAIVPYGGHFKTRKVALTQARLYNQKCENR